MMKKLLLLSALLLTAGCTAQPAPESEPVSSPKGCDAFEACDSGSTESSPASTFKESYEVLNGTENSSGKIHRTIEIPENNPFVESTIEEVVARLDAGDSFYLYVGDSKCPWCRAVIVTASNKAIEYGVDEILYLPIWDDEGNEILRDKYELQDGAPVLVTEGKEGYARLLQVFDAVLEPYVLMDGDKGIEVGEKRIFAPNFFRIEEGGKSVVMTDGIPGDMTDPRAELTEEQIQETADKFDEFFK